MRSVAGRSRQLDLVVEDSGESTEKSDVLELIRDSWRLVGIRMFSKPSQLTLFRNRVFSGETLMSIEKGIENGLATAEMSPSEFAPTSQQQLEWPKWGQYMETKGKAGEPPDLPGAVKLKQRYQTWLDAVTPEDHARIWARDARHLGRDEVYTIGTVAGVLQPVVVSDRLAQRAGRRHLPTTGTPGRCSSASTSRMGFWFDNGEARHVAFGPADLAAPTLLPLGRL